jgi:hypothetical protein
MIRFDINDEKFKNIDKKEVSIDAILTDAKDFVKKFGMEKLKYFNKLFSKKYTNMKSFKGVYIFVVNKKNKLVLDDDFFKDTYIYRKMADDKCQYIRTISSSYRLNKFRQPGDAAVTLDHERVFYCGRSDTIIYRTNEHLSSDNYSGTMSLKLGFESRKWVREFLKCYFLLIDDVSRADVEKDIKNIYGAYFGDY